MRSIMDTKKHPDYSDAYQKIYGSLEEKKSGMSSDAMSSILKGNRYSGKELFNMSKKSTQQGRHGEAHALYKEFQKKKSTKEEVEPRVGRHRAEFERYKEELKEDHVSKFNAWVENLQKEGFDVTRWDPEELIDTYIKENDLWTSRKSVIEAVGDGYPARREGPQKGLGTALCPTCGQFGCNKDHEAEKEAEVKEEFKALTPDKKDQIRNQAERRKKSADRAQNASDYKTSTKQDQQVRKMKSVLKNEEWKPDPVEKRQKKAADLHRRETIAQDTPTKYKTDKTEDPNKLYKRRMAVDSKTKMRESFSNWRLDLVDKQILGEEEYDHWKDRNLEKYGTGWRGTDSKGPSSPPSSSKKTKGKTVLQRETEKKYGKGKSALDIVKAKIEAEHGKGAIMSTKKK